MDSGESELIFSLADAATIEYQGKPLHDKWNYFNHLLVSPDSSRFIVLHRCAKAPAAVTMRSPKAISRRECSQSRWMEAIATYSIRQATLHTSSGVTRRAFVLGHGPQDNLRGSIYFTIKRTNLKRLAKE